MMTEPIHNEEGPEKGQEQLLPQRPNLDWEPIDWPEPGAEAFFGEPELTHDQLWALPAETSDAPARPAREKADAVTPALKAGIDAFRAIFTNLRTLAEESEQLRRHCSQIDDNVHEMKRSVCQDRLTCHFLTPSEGH